MSDLFYHIYHIQFQQNKNHLNLCSAEKRKGWSTFMILKFFSMDHELLLAMNHLNKYQGQLSDEQMYEFIIRLLPKKKYNLNYLKEKKKEDIDQIIGCIQQAYDCTPNKAYEYYKILNKKEINYILRSFALKE